MSFRSGWGVGRYRPKVPSKVSLPTNLLIVMLSKAYSVDVHVVLDFMLAHNCALVGGVVL
jgi:hypothetical protein